MDGHPIGDEESFREFLRGADEIKLTHHFRVERLPLRPNISKGLIEQYVRNPGKLVKFQYSDDGHSREKYECLFDKSTKYLLKIVLSAENETIFILTAHLINKEREESFENLL